MKMIFLLPVAWKTWKCQGMLQLSGKRQRFELYEWFLVIFRGRELTTRRDMGLCADVV